MDKAKALEDLKKELEANADLPLRKGATQLVFGEGSPDAKLYFLGEAPGYWEDQKGRPFVGQAGQLLDETLLSIGLKRADVYISNVVRFRPPANRDPLPEEIDSFAPYVDREIDIIKPEIIVTLGRFSMAKFLPNQKISQIHGKTYSINYKGENYKVVPMFHPAAALRSTGVLNAFRQDFKKLKDTLDSPQANPGSAKAEITKPNQLSLLV